MDKNTACLLAFFLSLAAFSIGTLPLFEFMGFISHEGWFYSHIVIGVMFGYWGWLVPIALGVISFRMVHQTQSIVNKIPAWLFSVLAVVSGLVWAVLIICMVFILANFNW